jgi:hypothetical protein
MGQISGPYGLRGVKILGEQYFTGGMHTYKVTNPSAIATQGCYFGDPVGLQGGSVVPLAASPVAGPPGTIGIFQGCSWQDPIRGFVNAQYLPAGIFSGGATDVKVKVLDNPQIVMRVQADGPVTPDKVGLNGALGQLGQGNTQTGNSKVNLLTASIAAGAALAVRIYGFVEDAGPSPGAGSMPGDAFTDVLVVWNFGIDRYLNATGG